MPAKGGEGIYISHLSLTNFRNYSRLRLDLAPGLNLFWGKNGQGKSNLLEALYILAIAKSPRSSSDRELVRWSRHHRDEEGFCQVAATVQADQGPVKIQMDIQCAPSRLEGQGDDAHRAEKGVEGITVQKQLRVNGVPRQASEVVGELNAVMFSAGDIELVLGPPPGRRRYMDILISQLDRRYLRALLKYQRVLYQRNHLLRMVREGRAKEEELLFWDQQLIAEGTYITAKRREMAAQLRLLAIPIHQELAGNGAMELTYRPSVPTSEGASEEDIERSFQEAIILHRQREVAQGVSRFGPHRDDIQLLIGGMDAGLYASRGEARTLALTLRLAEARYLAQQRNQGPVLLLDDVLSELDSSRRSHVLKAAASYDQCLITSTEEQALEGSPVSSLVRFKVEAGNVEPVGR